MSSQPEGFRSPGEMVREQFDFAARQYGPLIDRLLAREGRQARSFVDGEVVDVEPQDWTSGFFPGVLWLIYEHTGSQPILRAAEQFTARQAPVLTYGETHDLGFMIGCSCGEGHRIAPRASYREALILGARTLASRYSADVGLIKSWDFGGHWAFPVIIDNMMNLDLLFWAAKETGEERFRAIAMEHARKTLTYHFRDDASCYHVLDYDPRNGALRKNMNWQGFAVESAWARGQAWALYGFARTFENTGERAFLRQSMAVARFILNHPRLPSDGIPYWDFDVTNIPDALRDAAAGAVMASGFLMLAAHAPEKESAIYRDFALKQLRTLCTAAFRAGLNENGNFLLMHSVGHMPQRSEIDVPLIYADYYFLEALARAARLPIVATGRKLARASDGQREVVSPRRGSRSQPSRSR